MLNYNWCLDIAQVFKIIKKSNWNKNKNNVLAWNKFQH